MNFNQLNFKMEKDKHDYIEVQVVGINKKTWSELKSKLSIAVSKALDTVINYEENTTVREEAKEFASAIIAHAKAKLKKAGVENQKLLAEIDLLYTQNEKERANTRKLNAEANEIEISNMVKSLIISLGGLRALSIGQEEPEDILFIKQIETFLGTLNQMN